MKKEIYAVVYTRDGRFELTKGEWLEFDYNQLHRSEGPAVEYADGDREWRIDGMEHREDGPAFTSINGYKEWCLNGQVHRLDGPAVEYTSGFKDWYINGKCLNSEDVERWIEENKIDLSTEEGQVAFKIFWG